MNRRTAFLIMNVLMLLLFVLPRMNLGDVARADTEQRGARIDTLRYKVTRSPAAQRAEMTVGPPLGSDVWHGLVRPSDIEEMYAQEKEIVSNSGFHFGFIGFNYRRYPLDDVNFRHALAHLVPKDRIIGTLFKYVVVKINTPVPPTQWLWYNDQVDPHPYSPSEAENILNAAGYQKPADVWLDKDGEPLPDLKFYIPLEIVAPTSFTIGKILDEEAEAIGLTNLVPEPMDFSTYVDLVFNQQEFDMFWFCHSLSRFPTHLYWMFDSENDFLGGDNCYGVNWPALDALLRVLYFSLDHTAQVAACQEAQELIMGGSTTDPMPTHVPPGDPRSQAIPAIPIYSKNFYDVQHPDLRGAVNASGYGIDNMWTHLNISWSTPDEYRPGTSERTVVWVEEDFPERLNPLFASTPYAWDFMNLQYDGLLATNPYTRADVPWLALDWSFVQVSGGMDVTFDLLLTDSQGQPITWQDGTAISVNDIKFAWDFLHGWQIPSYWSAFRYYDPVNTIIVDSDTIRARMTNTSQWLIYSLASTAYQLPPQIWTNNPLTGSQWTSTVEILGFDPSAHTWTGNSISLPTMLFGTGPFILQHSTTFIGVNGYGDLDANRNYFLTTAEIQNRLRQMHIEASLPQIDILSPENKTYTTRSVPLTFTVNKPTSWLGYSLDGLENVTINGNTTLPNLSEGTHYIRVYANDTGGNMGSSGIVYFRVRAAGTLTVTTRPVFGEVFVNGTSWGVAPQSREVSVGTHTVSFGSVEGYHTPSDQLATVNENQETVVEGVYEVMPITGTLTVTTTPVYGEVFVNGSSWGLAPRSKTVGVGAYNVSFGHVAGYCTPAWQLATVQEDTEIVVSGEYEPITGTITIKTTPVSGEVFVNGTSWGVAPQSREVSVGTHTVSFGSVEGYYTPPDNTVIVSENEETLVEGVYEEMPATGTLSVSTTPVLGEVVVNGASWGLAPQNRIVDVGKYSVSFGPVAGHRTPPSQLVTVSDNVETSVTGIYEPIGVWIGGYVTDIETGTSLAGATVTADGVSTTTDTNGYYKIELAPGEYTLTVSASGYVSKSKTATVSPGETKVVNFPLAEPGVVAEEITEPDLINATNPFIINATEDAATSLIITAISDPIRMTIKSVTDPVDVGTLPGTWNVLGRYVLITVNNTDITVNATIRMYYTHEQLEASGLDESTLGIRFWNATSGEWEAIESHVNTDEHYVWAIIDHFSFFAIMGQPGGAPPVQLWFLAIAVVVIIAATLISVIYIRRRRTAITHSNLKP